MKIICKMCLQNKEGVDSHIVPAGFYRFIKDDSDEPLEVRPLEEGKYKRRSYTGIYDNTILCSDCERLFQNFDDYAQRLLLPNPKGAEYILNQKGETRGFKLNAVNYDYLKLFFLSVLWRASVSNREEFVKVDTGPFEEELKRMIKSRNPGTQDDFSVVVSRFNDYLGKRFLMNPHKAKITGLNYYIGYLGAGYKFYIKVDSGPQLGELSALILKPSQPFYIPFLEEFSESKELNLLKEIVMKNKK